MRISNLSINLLVNKSIKDFEKTKNHVSQVQKNLLLNILNENKNTKYGKEHYFSEITSLDEFTKFVPVNSYDDLKPYIEENKYKNNIILSAPIKQWAITSGTSGTHKYIPHSKKSLKLWNKGVIRAVSHFVLENPTINFLNYKYIFIVGPALVEMVNSIPAGYISGIIPVTSPLIGPYNITPDSINCIKDYNEKMSTLLKLSLDNPVLAFAGITTFTMNFIKYVQDNGYKILKDDSKYSETLKVALLENNKLDVTKLWPELKVLLSTGVSIDYCKENFSKLFPDAWIMNLYGGTEGAYGSSINSLDEKIYLNYDLYYFEFRDLETSLVYNLENIEINKCYEMIITCPNGLYRYTNGDLIEFISTTPPVIKVLGRSNVIINLGGEKLSDAEVNMAVTESMHKLSLPVCNYCFFGWVDSDCFVNHCLIIEEPNTPTDPNLLSEYLFETLKEYRISYRRSAGGLFKQPHIIFLKPGSFESLEEDLSNKKGIIGHSKLKHLYTKEEISVLIKKEWICNHSDSLNLSLIH